jgi:phosphoglucosamine mutase
MGKLFGTDGIRGVANTGNMTAEMVLEIGRATAYVCKRQNPDKKKHRIVIGKDTRVSGYLLENALTAGICSMGVDVFLLGPVPTPGIAFITQNMRADAGMVLSASHNPYQDNGIKIFSRTGYKLPDAAEEEIEDLVLSGHIRDIRATADEVGRAKRIDDALGRYLVFCKNTFPADRTLEGMKIVLDCANGATYKAAPIIFSELGADVTAIHVEPNGLNINGRCGSQHTEDLRREVLERGADVGLAFDGDGDRVIAIDEKGAELTGDHILAVCAVQRKEEGALPGDRVIGTVMSNFGFHQSMKDRGIEVGVARVGDRFVLEMMKETGAALGGEASGHIIFTDHHTTGDGIVSALQLLAVMCKTERPLSRLSRVMTLYPQVLINVDVKEKPPLEDLPELQAAVAAAEERLSGRGRILIRYSGTQSMCRVMVEGPDEEETMDTAQGLAECVKRCLT